MNLFVDAQSLQDIVARFTSMNFVSKEPAGSEDGAHIFEVFISFLSSKAPFLFWCIYTLFSTLNVHIISWIHS